MPERVETDEAETYGSPRQPSTLPGLFCTKHRHSGLAWSTDSYKCIELRHGNEDTRMSLNGRRSCASLRANLAFPRGLAYER